MATIVGDVTGQQQRQHPLNIPHLVKTIKGFPVKVKLFQNTATIKNSGEGFHPTPTPPTLLPRWVMNLRVRPRVKHVKSMLLFYRVVVIYAGPF